MRSDLPITKLAENVYLLNEFDGTNCYLVVGSEKALLIDCGTGFCDIRGAAEKLTEGDEFLFFGRVGGNLYRKEMNSPEIEPAEGADRIRPIYPQTHGLNSKIIEKLVRTALTECRDELVDPIPLWLREKYCLMNLPDSLWNIHFPKSPDYLEEARRRLIFEELLILQLGLEKMRSQTQKNAGAIIERDFSEEYFSHLPFSPTGAQRRAVKEAMRDMMSGQQMNRLLQGDVGSGKTAVAAALVYSAAKNSMQSALMAPTEVLAEQHYKTFLKLFEGCSINVELLTGSDTAAQKRRKKEALKAGEIDLLIGTHKLLQKNVSFHDLGLLIIDEEQHFGVAHKERLKQLRSDVHVLTLTATPIPRTLQMALTGVRELSIIATPPVDRLAVRTFVLPFDPVIIREALIRERMRGGQTFYVCPRISDMDEVMKKLKVLVPEIKVVAAHGRMSPKELEDIMTAFADKKYDVLLSTTIIESGLDMPSVNTIVIHRADMFGLAQLYQLRGRVGRSKTRGYAYLTLPPKQKVGKTALKRMEVMQKLDTLGAGFTLASYDLDIRGAGNLLGEEQSGHIKEVGIELYQKMLEEAVAEARSGGLPQEEEQTSWSPQINAGMPVLIPETYVRDLGIRMGLYKRLAEMTELNEIESFGAEMTDRFGSLPAEVENLLEIIAIKTLCRKANVEKIEAGPKGAVITLRNNRFPNPAGLVKFIAQNNGAAKLRPDQKIVYKRVWEIAKDRIKGMRKLMAKMAEIAAEKE